MIRLIVGGQDFTNAAQDLQWTSVDPGGCETCQFTLPAIYSIPTPGTRVRVFEGLTCIWDGRVEEPGQDLDETKTPGSVAAVGAGVLLKDNRMSMVFMDRDLGRWQGPGRARQAAVLAQNFGTQGFQVRPDPTSGAPALATEVRGDWAATAQGLSEAWYDAGPGNLIGRIRATWTRGPNVSAADGNWVWAVVLSTNDVETLTDSTGDLQAAGPGTVDHASTGSKRFAVIKLYYPSGAQAGTAGMVYNVDWTNTRVVGDHGLTIRGVTAATEGFYPQDIVRYVLGLVDGIEEGVIDAATDLIVPHAVYRDPVTHETPIRDMGTLRGYHWGVWPARSMFDDTPVLDFRPPPAAATAIVDRRDCRQLQLAQRMSDFHDTALVKYSDVAGSAGYVTVTRANPRLPAGTPRTVDVDVGVADASIAAAVGLDVLELEEQQTRAAGPAILPPLVVTPAGGLKPATMLQPGIDRLKITGLPDAGAWTETDSRRFDTFRIQRLTCRRDKGGAVTSTAELDSGQNLVETLQARLVLAAGLAG